MFSFLTDKLYKIYDLMKGINSLDEKSLESFFLLIRDNLIQADVALVVIDKILADLKKRVVGVKVNRDIKPGEYLAREFYAVVLRLLQSSNKEGIRKDIIKNFVLEAKKSKKPFLLFVVGLQGAGKTTTIGKIIHSILHHNPKLSIVESDLAVVSLDYDRPAAREQLRLVGQSMKVESVIIENIKNAIDGARILQNMINNQEFKKKIIIVDTAGRLAIDAAMMAELKEVYHVLKPQEVFLVIDNMVSQEGVTIAQSFVKTIPCSGCIVTKVDSDAPGGIILGLTSLLSLPILYLTTGEKPSDIKLFDPVATAKRLIGMGEVFELVKIAEKKIAQAEEVSIKESIKKGDININDFITILNAINKMGPMKQIFSMLPKSLLGDVEISNDKMNQIEKFNKYIVVLSQSMTKKEKLFPNILQQSEQRKMRIAKGAGMSFEVANNYIDLFFKMRSGFNAYKKFF
jgi:signal recognition particle subunit SRP54